MINPLFAAAFREFKSECLIETAELDQNIGLRLNSAFSSVLHLVRRAFLGNRVSENADIFLLYLFQSHFGEILAKAINHFFDSTPVLLVQQNHIKRL